MLKLNEIAQVRYKLSLFDLVNYRIFSNKNIVLITTTIIVIITTTTTTTTITKHIYIYMPAYELMSQT